MELAIVERKQVTSPGGGVINYRRECTFTQSGERRYTIWVREQLNKKRYENCKRINKSTLSKA